MTDPDRPSVFLHVGAPKSGTTFLQGMLWTNRDRLRRDGFLYPGQRWESHVWATLDLRKVKFKGYADPNTVDAWPNMVAEIRDFHGPAIIDQELLSGAFPDQIDRAKQDLAFADLHHHLHAARHGPHHPGRVAGVGRRTGRPRPSLSSSRRFAGPSRNAQRRGQADSGICTDAESILEKWSRDLPPENVHLITIPRPGSDPDILWNALRHRARIGSHPLPAKIATSTPR